MSFDGVITGAIAEEMLLDLLSQVFAMLGIDQIEPVLVDDHGLHLDPLLPRFLGNVLENPLAKGARIGRKIEALCLAAELDAFDGACHVKLRG